MCGIAGYINLDGKPASSNIVRAMCNAIEHRGPDSEGQVVSGNVGFGHRRLAIIDLSSLAHQPMVTRDDDLILTYNGEVYNFNELKSQLEARGHRFRSTSDTEVVLEAISEWGVSAFSRFNGMFALAAYCKKTNSVTLSRDLKWIEYQIQ